MKVLTFYFQGTEYRVSDLEHFPALRSDTVLTAVICKLSRSLGKQKLLTQS